jgi:hypothetical protein
MRVYEQTQGPLVAQKIWISGFVGDALLVKLESKLHTLKVLKDKKPTLCNPIHRQQHQ